MNEEQAARVKVVDPDQIWKVPDGSYFIIRNRRHHSGEAPRRAGGGEPQHIEILDPAASGALSFDLG